MQKCDHKFVDSRTCGKCGVPVDQLSGDQRSSRTQRRDRWRVFACEPLVAGWIVGWLIDGIRIEQCPQLRVEANRPLEFRTAAERVVAIFARYDGKPPSLLQLEPDSEGRTG
jgi:hypothetical protein